MRNKKKCFVVMPFSSTKSCSEEKWTEIFEYIIKPAVEESSLGYKCKRSVAARENIIKGILEALNQANVVIADLTDNNPNVFYELGVRHTLTNRTILIAQGEEHIPFDLKPYPVAFYGESPAKIAEFKADIKKKLKDIETTPERADNPVADFLQLRNIALLAYEKKENLKKLSALISEISFNISTVDNLIDIVKRNKKARKAGKEGSYSTERFSHSCLDLLLSSAYVMPSEEFQSTIRYISATVMLLNNWLDGWTDERFEKQTEEEFERGLPQIKDDLIGFLRTISKLRTDYADENYIEPAAPIICLAEQEHEQYLKSAI
jgi:hypothetical protein